MVHLMFGFYIKIHGPYRKKSAHVKKSELYAAYIRTRQNLCGITVCVLNFSLIVYVKQN